jgi:uncharacterized membrane protein
MIDAPTDIPTPEPSAHPLPAAPVDALETAVSRVLGWGLAMSCAVVLAGGLLMLARGQGEAAGGAAIDLATFRAEPAALRSIPSIISGAARLDPPSVVLLGALLLIATPIARVALALAVFAARRDRLYIAISAVLLAVLVASLFLRG